MGFWSGDDWAWDCQWRHHCVERASSEEEQFRDLINGVKVRNDKIDFWRRVHKGDGVYFVKAAYAFLTPLDCILDKRWTRVIWSISRFCSSSSRCSPREKKKRGTQPCLGKLVRKLGIFPFLSCSRTLLEPRNFPPCRKLPDLLCSSLCCPPAALVCGGELLRFLFP
ncbi:hypothetical protein SLEP1_g12176 [Rubroshorea leprosula]|uniref:Uncharacterized protein n=1 Tax=Rubroshorea leprosula TaxID=152421 RepID=A0AAV5IK53_9ROSI|nr:hypothetical protein SLEP1_g12176 [Rubroshorea leprosula]